MNWQTEELFEEAMTVIDDESVFSPIQIELLKDMIHKISEAVEKESSCTTHYHS